VTAGNAVCLISPMMLRALVILVCFCLITVSADAASLKAGAAAISITPYGPNSGWHGPTTPSGNWGERFRDTNHNNRWDVGESFTDDKQNAALDPHSKGKYDGIYLAGFGGPGENRLATGKHDDLWARALVLDCNGTRIAIVSLDLIGYYQHSGYYGVDEARKFLDPGLGIQELLVTSTHNHEGPDTIGLWGGGPNSDGKFALYLQFVDRQIAKAVTLAARALAPVRMKLGATGPQLSPALENLQIRTAGRPPYFFDEELRVMQFIGTEGEKIHKAAATLVNWNTHPESLEDQNTLLTSDFPGAVRDAIEREYGGLAIYISGDLGAVEIVGDNGQGARTRFHGRNFGVSMKLKTFTFERMQAIGADVAEAASDAIKRAEWSDVTSIEVKKADMRVPLDNLGFQFLINKGILAKLPGVDAPGGPEVVSTIYAIRIGTAQIITAPGELFPEVFYGVGKYRRRDCPKADTGQPAEPAVFGAMTAKYKFVFGLCPDELGYIVPRYDFRSPTFDPESGVKEAADACAARGIPAHYHETNSASSELAPAWACTAARLLGQTTATEPACAVLSYKAKQ
jgi:hypothetical protein